MVVPPAVSFHSVSSTNDRAVTAPPPGYRGRVPYGFGVVELTREKLRIVTRLKEADTDALTFGQSMALVADELPDGVVTWAFA